ncbi:SusC/RagA family TonB-linked outer membrane protein [Sphingobacterium hungaricum]|uniref:SusC/RagA family TonB-linked outer membrane protein n=1 Tax=Sphingobacterium hungaricum TaxID=2082723 RepID=A0A928UZR6_9SPHI|nr:TonB-dependent receptor [Sphingobacterium hungaricum]MBE8715083.1 SusC/RagA family TonB-linked outer membrane protein [Sphingobacterium hungaricum]
MRNLFTLLLFMVCTIPFAYSQTGSVSGTVKDGNSQMVLPGVTVTVQGKSISTQTDASGKYTINATGTDVLLFNFIGFSDKSVSVNNLTTIDVFLDEEDQSIDEVVVVGYGTQRKVDLTGSIGSVKASDIAKQPATSAMQSIQGKVSGLNIVANEQPGSSPTVLIRGMGSALGGRNPFYVVDGIPADNINNISPSDILSINVLKDASSASIYGIRAANGVIMVTTKKGSAGRTQISYDGSFGIKGILNRVDMADANQFITYFNENAAAIGQSWTLQPNQENNTDWYDELIQNGQVYNNSINLSGGSEVVDYYLSYNNLTEKGVLEGSKFQRHTIRNNNTYKFFDNKLKFMQTLNLTMTNATPKPLAAFDAAYKQSPLVPVMYENGRYGRPFVNQTTGLVTYESTAGQTVGNLNSIGNPVFENYRYNELLNTVSIQGSFEGEYQITNYLKFNSRFSGTKVYNKNRNFSNVKEAWLNADPRRTEAEFEALKLANPTSLTYVNNTLTTGQSESFRWAWENFLTFQKSFDKHNLELIAGTSLEKFNIGNNYSATGYDVPDQEQYWNINMASSGYNKSVNQTYITPTALQSYFARGQYNYDSRYYFTATVRYDGTSTFKASGDYYDVFPSFGAGWTISNESFAQDISWLNFLKVRANWGRLGNQAIPLNVSQVLQSTGTNGNENVNYVFGPNQDLIFGAAYATPVIPLSWEVTEETGVGVDFTLFNSHLTGSFDYYHKLNTNAILSVKPLLNSTFSQNFYDHGAKILNSGFEANLSWNKSVNENLSYTVGVNYSYNKNEVTDVKPTYDGNTGGSLANGQITKQLREGQPIYAWWMWETDGVWQTQDEINAGAKYGSPRPGHLKYKDQNGDNVIDDRDKVFLGSYIPTSIYGVNLGINYKAIDFSIDGYGVGGNKIYNGLKGTRIDGGENIAASTFENRWTGPNSSNTDPGAARDSYASSYYLESGAYFRINNVTLGYTFRNLYSNTSNLRVFFTAQNPLIFTKYSGFSPEITGTDNGNPAETSGIELSAYPTTRNFIFGVNMSF